MTVSKGNKRVDLRVDLILRVEQEHMFAFASSAQSPRGEEWRCKCGKHHKGKGALMKGRRHQAKKVLAALDQAAQVA